MKRSTLVTTIGVELAKKGVWQERIASAVDEWLDGHKWAGELFDRNGWDFGRFVLDVKKVWKSHRGEGSGAI